MICPNCGRENSDEAKFCAGCGQPINAASQEASGNSSYGQPGGYQPNMGPAPQPTYEGGYQAGSNFQQVNNSGVQERNIAMCIILSIVTCGIYGLYWIYTLTEDTNKLSNNPNATSGGMVILLGIVTCGIYMWYWLYKRGEAIDTANALRGRQAPGQGALYLILGIFGLGLISYCLIQNEINNLCK